MNSYLCSVILTTAGCHLVLLAAGEFGSENNRKNLRFLCGIIVLLTLFSPVRELAHTMHTVLESVSEEMESMEKQENVTDTARYAVAAEYAYEYVAEQWITYIAENYPVQREQISIRIHTSEQEKIETAEIILHDCPYAIRNKLEKQLTSLMDFPIVVKGE